MPVVKVKSLRSGKIYVLYGWEGPFIRLWKGKWVLEPMEYYEPVEDQK